MQHAAAVVTIEIDFVGIGNYAELREIKMRVPALQWIERPRHLLHDFLKCPLALREFQAVAKVEIAVLGQHGQHVRVESDVALFKGKKPECEANHVACIEVAYEHRPGFLRSDRQSHRRNITVVEAPDFLLDGTDLAEILDGL